MKSAPVPWLCMLFGYTFPLVFEPNFYSWPRTSQKTVVPWIHPKQWNLELRCSNVFSKKKNNFLFIGSCVLWVALLTGDLSSQLVLGWMQLKAPKWNTWVQNQNKVEKHHSNRAFGDRNIIAIVETAYCWTTTLWWVVQKPARKINFPLRNKDNYLRRCSGIPAYQSRPQHLDGSTWWLPWWDCPVEPQRYITRRMANSHIEPS